MRSSSAASRSSVQPRHLRLRERLVANVLIRLPAPQPERLAKARRCRFGLAARPAPTVRARPGAQTVQHPAHRLHAQSVSRPVPFDALGRQPLTQPVHVHLQGVHRRRGRPLAPERVDQPVARDNVAASNEQAREKCHLLSGRKLDRAGPGGDLHRPEDAELHGCTAGVSHRIPAQRSHATHKSSRAFSQTRRQFLRSRRRSASRAATAPRSSHQTARAIPRYLRTMRPPDRRQERSSSTLKLKEADCRRRRPGQKNGPRWRGGRASRSRPVIAEGGELPVYLKIADNAKHLRELGMSDRAIAHALGVSDKTIAKVAGAAGALAPMMSKPKRKSRD